MIVAICTGGYMPLFGFRLTAESANPHIITPGETTVTNTTIYDTTKTTTDYTTAVWCDQYLIRRVVERTQVSGISPNIVLSSSDTNKATIDQIGNLSWVGDGKVFVIGTTPYGTYRLQLTMITHPASATQTITYTADTFDASKHMLILYNSGASGDSTVKDYYLATRPGMSTSNVLACNCTTSGTDNFETITRANFDSQIGTPIKNWLSSNPTKFPRYILLSYGMPSRTSGSGSWSVQYLISRLLADAALRTGNRYESSASAFSIGIYPGMTALVSSLNMSTAAAAMAYVDRLHAMYDDMASPNVLISASDASYNTTTPTYAIDDNSSKYYPNEGREAASNVLSQNSSAYIKYGYTSGYPTVTGSNVTNQASHITSASNVTGFQTWGGNGGQGGNYANGGGSYPVVFSGDSGWYIIETIESYNGQRSISYQGNVVDWFSQTAFGSTNYEFCPIFAVSHVEEPYLSGVNTGMYFGLWELGLTAIEAAWSSRKSEFMQAVGDPMVKK